MAFPLLTWAVVGATGIAAKYIYDAVTDSSSSSSSYSSSRSDNSYEVASRAREIAEQQREQERQERHYKQLEQSFITALHGIKRDYLPQMTIPASIPQHRIAAFKHKETQSFGSAVFALEGLTGQKITVTQDRSEIGALEMQIKILDKLELFVRELGS